MPDGRIILGTRRYSSWSLRGWLAVRLAGLDVEEVVIPLRGGDTEAVKALSPSGRVPVLEHRGATIWESIAICEYCAEIAPALWPADRAARAHARAIAAEMHAGFRDLRSAWPMNLGAAQPATPAAAVQADIRRILAIWQGTAAFGTAGPYLFGLDFTAADAMFAPVVARFLSYQPDLPQAARAYCTAVRAHPLVDRWYALAAAEPDGWRDPRYETVR